MQISKQEQSTAPPVGSILLYKDKSFINSTPWSNINHLAFQLSNGMVYHMTFNGLRKTHQSRMNGKYTLVGYILPKNKWLRNKIENTCFILNYNHQALSYISPNCPRQWLKLLDIRSSCIQSSNPNIERSKQDIAILEDILQLNPSARQIHVCSTFMFWVLAYAISKLKSQYRQISGLQKQEQGLYQGLLSAMNIKRCHPSDAMQLPQKFPTLFEFVSFQS